MPGSNVEKAYWLDLREAGGEPVLALPLISRREGGLTILSSPDLGVTDYNPPLLGRAEIVAAHDREDLWSALRGALPSADLLRLKRMPAQVGDVPNPLARHGLAVCARTSGWVVQLPESWDTYFASLTPKMREKLGKCRRRFLRQPGARFVVTEDVIRRWPGSIASTISSASASWRRARPTFSIANPMRASIARLRVPACRRSASPWQR